jgi:hypothetical protein
MKRGELEIVQGVYGPAIPAILADISLQTL